MPGLFAEFGVLVLEVLLLPLVVLHLPHDGIFLETLRMASVLDSGGQETSAFHLLVDIPRDLSPSPRPCAWAARFHPSAASSLAGPGRRRPRPAIAYARPSSTYHEMVAQQLGGHARRSLVMVRRQDQAGGVMVCARESARYRHPLSPRRKCEPWVMRLSGR